MAGLWLGACTADEPREGEHIDFIFEAHEYELCTGTAAHLDGYIEGVFKFLGTTPGEFVVPVDVVTTVTCGEREDATGCYDPNDERVIVSLDEYFRFRPTAVLRHEVTHAIVHRAWGSSVPFFQEGLAESLSRTEAVNTEWMPEPRPILDMLDSPANEVDYEAAALFTRYLIDRIGVAAFRTIYQGVHDGTRSEIVTRIEAATGEAFAALEADFLSGAPRCTFAIDLCDPQGAVTIAVGDSWSTAFEASCLAPEFYGSQSSEAMFTATQLRVELQGTGRYRVHLLADAEFDPSVELMRCGDCEEQFVRRIWDGMELDLGAGLYAVEFTVKPFAHPIEFGLEYVGSG
ncbi:hypothetical protein [Nannocystis pusilla]|uniref:hypothetical protein n=1 Tax=Nannocystis pusilla TaxID=889268 RepID=UPI003DA2C241